MTRLCCCLLLVGLIVSALGCGNANLGEVEGEVLLDGKPLPNATVTFQPLDGSPSYGRTDAEGHYQLEYTPSVSGAEIGEHTVQISTEGIDMVGEEKIERPELVPASFQAQTVTRTVKPGSQRFDFKLNSDPR